MVQLILYYELESFKYDIEREGLIKQSELLIVEYLITGQQQTQQRQQQQQIQQPDTIAQQISKQFSKQASKLKHPSLSRL